MAVYNASLYIRETMDSILKQTFSDFEFIIINDASSDDTLDIIKSFKDDRIKLFNNGTNLGQTPSLNKGIDLAQGKYIARMDADDIASLNRFELQNNFLERNETVAVLGSSYSILGTDIIKRLDYSPEVGLISLVVS
jgi:glycosyltransferase involved in cell wall biosynthesis